MKSAPILKFDARPPSASAPENGAAWLESLDVALQAVALAAEPLQRHGDDRPKFIALSIAREKAAESRAAAAAIFFPGRPGEPPERQDAVSRHASALDALAASEHGRARLLSENSDDGALDAAETAVKHAARAVEREIAAAETLAGKEAAARNAELVAAWARFWPPYLALQTEFAGHLRAALALAEKIRRINSFADESGACPGTGAMPWPNEEFLLRPAAIADYFKACENAVALEACYTAKRSAGA